MKLTVLSNQYSHKQTPLVDLLKKIRIGNDTFLCVYVYIYLFIYWHL